jgi:hypothetical protein
MDSLAGRPATWLFVLVPLTLAQLSGCGGATNASHANSGSPPAAMSQNEPHVSLPPFFCYDTLETGGFGVCERTMQACRAIRLRTSAAGERVTECTAHDSADCLAGVHGTSTFVLCYVRHSDCERSLAIRREIPGTAYKFSDCASRP